MNRRISFMLALTVFLMACSANETIKTKAKNNRLSPCPTSPNCVSSLSEDKSHYVEPLKFRGTPEEAREKLIAIIHSMKRAEIITAEIDYIHATFKSALFGFVDDVEFSFDDQRKVIDVKSASRTGYSDLGVNRKRVEEIRKKFANPY
jgi:uncharacterized protein (DUF1499 family)